MSSGPPPASPNQQNPGPAPNGGELSAVIAELKQLVDLQKASIGFQQANNKLLSSNQQSGVQTPNQQLTDERGFPIRGKGAEGLYRHAMLGADTTKKSAKAIGGSISKAVKTATAPITKTKTYQRVKQSVAKAASRVRHSKPVQAVTKVVQKVKASKPVQGVVKMAEQVRHSKVGQFVENNAGAIGKAGGAAVDATKDLVMGFIKARDAISEWTEKAMESAKHLAGVSGSMAGAMAERMVLQIKRDQIKGEATGGTTKNLVRSEDDRKKAEDRVDIVWTNVKNKALEWGNDLVTKVLNPFASAVEKFAKVTGADKLGKNVDPKALGLGSMEKQAIDWANAIDKRGQTLMDIARQAGAQGNPPPNPMGGRP